MKRIKLLLEHRFGGRVLKKLKLLPEGRPLVIGSNQKSDLRLIGEEVSPFHACLEARGGEWFIYDFASTSGTWINKETILEHKISSAVVVKIGLHELYLQPIEDRAPLFASESDPSEKTALDFQQVIMRSEAGIIETKILNRNEAYKMKTATGWKEFKAPTGSSWVTHQEGRYVVQQRLVPNPGTAAPPKNRVEEGMKWPLFVTSTALLVLAVIIGLRPGQPDSPKSLPELQNNSFASLIYDAKIMAEKKKESKEIIEKKFKGSMQGTQGSAKSDQIIKGAQTATKLISQVKAQGLSQLIGKIAKRASSNTALIETLGKTADSGPTGRAVASIGGNLAAVSVGNPGVSQGHGYKLSGVGTTGKGGGGNYKEGTGLGVGKIGSSNVGIIEEESEVSGGLDKDVIAEVIKSELGQIRYCYERQLSGNPDLYGKVMIKFTIGTAGLVVEQKVGTSTLKNADVEGCILRRVARWKFPTPRGGTTVLVSYPFLFKSTN
jgi:hypothetical protein